MVDYNPSHGQISVNGRLIGKQRAEQMICELEDAIDAATFHESLPDDVNFNARAISILQSEYGEDDTHRLGVEVSVEQPGEIPTEYFEQDHDSYSEDTYNSLDSVTGLVEANDIQSLYDEVSNLVMFHVMFPNEV